MASRMPIARMRISRMRILPNPLFASRAPIRASRRTYATEPQPTNPSPPPPYPQSQSQQPKSGSAGKFYKSFGSPVLKCFLGALFTYQLAYWAWMKLESLDERNEQENEISSLKAELKELLIKKKEAESMLAEAVETVDEKVVKPVKKGWW